MLDCVWASSPLSLATFPDCRNHCTFLLFLISSTFLLEPVTYLGFLSGPLAGATKPSKTASVRRIVTVLASTKHLRSDLRIITLGNVNP